MRNMSFMLTTQQFRERTKTVTRRLGWRNAKVGELLMGVEKGQGLKRGEKIKRLGVIRIVSVRRESLRDAMTQADVVREGFPDMNCSAFVVMFSRHNKCSPDAYVNRIEFEYVGQQPVSSEIDSTTT